MIFTCDNCHYTFKADSLPESCPDCGKEMLNRRIGSRVIQAPAVRNATDTEIAWYEEGPKEQDLSALRELMTVDEYNWSLIMKYEHQSKTADARSSTASYLAAIRQDPDRAADIYLTVRRLFTGKINNERAKLKTQGISDASVYGSALWVLYQFKSDSGIPAFLTGPPNLGNVRRIDLEKIARNPSPAYMQFLLDWEKMLIGGK